MFKQLVLATLLATAAAPAMADDDSSDLSIEATADNYNCHETWDNAGRADISCTPLTEKLLASLRFASRADVTKAMKAGGREVPGAGLHFADAAEPGGGTLNVIFQDNRAIIVFASIDQPGDEPHLEYIWNSELGECSDFRGSHVKCSKFSEESKLKMEGVTDTQLDELKAEIERLKKLGIVRD